jgi:flavin reductase (DIM6/NTAB) family NADH-FMN oxidoreductase RutF
LPYGTESGSVAAGPSLRTHYQLYERRMPIDNTLYKHVLRNFAAGVTVVTTGRTEDEPHGLTATAFCSVSLVPPLVLACIDKKAISYPYFEPAGIFAVNFLRADQEHLSQHFATHGGEKFNDLDWKRGEIGAPILGGTIGHVECRIVGAYDAGDHTIYLGQVESAGAGDGEPLLHFHGAYYDVASR